MSEKPVSRARERQLSRERRRAPEAMAVPRQQAAPPDSPAQRPAVGVTARIDTAALRKRADLLVKDALWYARYRPRVWQIGGGVLALVVLLFLLSHWVPGRIFPNVYALGVPVGGLTVGEAAAKLDTAFADEVRIALRVEGQVVAQVAPAQLGISLDSMAAAEAAKAAGLGGIPFGYNVEPPIRISSRVAEDFMIAQAGALDAAPRNATYAFQNGVVIGVEGVAGRQLDIPQTVELLAANPASAIRNRRLDVLVIPIAPDFPDPAPHLMTARALTQQPFQLAGYDPFTDSTTLWATSPENVVQWLEVGASGLKVRPIEFTRFLEALNTEIQKADPQRYIERDAAVAAVQRALDAQTNLASLRLSHYPETYTVERGDTAYGIATRRGLPYFLVAEANAGRDLASLYPGDVIRLPSRDATVPLPPVPHKRIVVDIETQMLYGFENGSVAFSWPISTGVEKAPTLPGVYQILNHTEVAYGSSYTLCNNDVCGQWKMWWFMGMYEVTTGLMNGFHGQVELPNGALLGGGNVGSPYTFGCVMSRPEEAEFLYRWADDGVVVEIISNGFEPTSEAGRYVKSLRGGAV
ncbi:MAG: L,D-transpeptidase family protein [Anaerolineae bacterium]|nr:L,D-transpeptidase family protein [Anaerolineae bacterium]